MENEPRQHIILRKTQEERGREQKAGFVFISVTGILAIILGGLYIVRHVGSPFDLEYQGPQLFSTEEQLQRELEKQQTTDTDGDGLSDYDELYVLKTSPYLFDTDGDGYSDLEEWESDMDPTCAEGTNCVSSSVTNPYSQNDTTFDFLEDAEQQRLDDPSQTAVDPQAVLEEIQNLNSEQIRELLIAAGATEEELSALTDEQLQELYQQVILELQASGEIDAIIEQSAQ